MTLIVEDGKMREKANSYISLEDADGYLLERQLWPVSDDGNEDIIAVKEGALIRAFDWLNNLKWKGRKHCWENVQAWPRIEVPMPDAKGEESLDPYLIPKAVIQAQCELAVLIYNGGNFLSPVEHGGQIKSVSNSTTNKIDVISESKSSDIVYRDNAPVDAWLPTVYPLIQDFLEEVPGQINNKICVVFGVKG